MALTTALSEPIELKPGATEADLQVVIDAVYKQVLGNVHLFAGDRLDSAESQLRNGDISVRDFVRSVAQSELYKSLFFDGNPAYRCIELNCKHLLGRAPLDQAEIAKHTQIYSEKGYTAEIDSYINSEEYSLNFGENIVPYARCTSTQTGIANNVFNQTISLVGGFAGSDTTSNAAVLTSTIAGNLPQTVKVASSNGGPIGSTNKQFLIAVAKAGVTPIARLSKATYKVTYDQMSQQIQNIHKTGAKILSITEVV